MSVVEVVPHPEDGLPRPPAWRVQGEAFLALTPAARVALLEALPGADSAGYWVLHQGAMAHGSQRQLLVNLDSPLALQAALSQRFGQREAPSSLVVQRLPPQQAAGVLFSRHPRRPDLDQMVVERGDERLIFHPDGRLAWRSQGQGDDALIEALGAFGVLLNRSVDTPRAVEWIWDGKQLWVIQMLSIGTLPTHKEAWTWHSVAASTQVISPLWYTLYGRWLKAGFWRVLGERAGWRHLANIEPFRRQHSHLYLNSQFPQALVRWRRKQRAQNDVPPAWRQPQWPAAKAVTLWQLWWWRWQGRRLQRQLDKVLAQPQDDLWLQLMALDQLGERIAALQATVRVLHLPEHAGSTGLGAAEVQLLRALAEPDVDQASLAQQFPVQAAGNDPVWPRWQEQPGDLQRLHTLLSALPSARRDSLARLQADAHPLAQQLDALDRLRRRLTAALRALLMIMAQQLSARGDLHHPDDICFLYFDELWQCWRGEARAGLRDKLAERKVRYLTDAHSGAPDWIIDQVGYGNSAFASENRQPLLRGYGVVAGEVRGTVRRLVSGWQLNQLEPGDIVVLNRCEPGWLPWLTLAGALVMTHRDERDPALALARALQIPSIWGVSDALHSVVDGDVMVVDGAHGSLMPLSTGD